MKATKPNKTTEKYLSAFLTLYVSSHFGEPFDPCKAATEIWDCITKNEFDNTIKHWNIFSWFDTLAWVETATL